MELVMSGAFHRGRVVAALQPCPIKRWTPMELVMSGAFQRGRVVAALQPCLIKRWTPMEFVNCGNHAFAMAVAKLLTTNLFCRYGVGQSCRSDGKVATSGHAVTGPAE